MVKKSLSIVIFASLLSSVSIAQTLPPAPAPHGQYPTVQNPPPIPSGPPAWLVPGTNLSPAGKLQIPTPQTVAPQNVVPQLIVPMPQSTSNDRQPANITTIPTTPSPNQNLQVLDPTGAWIPLGTIDASSHTISGLGSQGVVYATQPDIGMKSSTSGNVFDNAPLVAIFNNVSSASSSTTIFPGNFNGQQATYYFTKPLHWTSHGLLTCQGTDYFVAPALVFAPGVDGVAFDNGYVSPNGGRGEGTIDGCRIISLGWGSGDTSDGANFITHITMNGYGPIPATTWEVGDGIIATSTGSGYLHPRYPNVTTLKHGAYVAAIDTSADYGIKLTLGAGFTHDFDNENTLYNFKYNTNATSAWALGAPTIQVADCTFWGHDWEVHDAQYSPTKLVGMVQSCTGTTLTLKVGALTASSGSTDKLNRYVGDQIIRLPVELGYNATTQGPINITATAAWAAGDTTISVPNGSCTGIITGDMVHAASGAPVTEGATVYDYGADPTNPWYMGKVKSCSGTTMTFSTALSTASAGASDALTLVSRIAMISGGNGDPLFESDYIWSDAFELGNMVSVEVWGSPANGGTETMIIHGANDYPTLYANGWPQSAPWGGQDPHTKYCPGSVPYPIDSCIVGSKTNIAGSGKLWKLPSGFHKRVTSDSRNISPQGWFIGYEDVGNGALGAAGRDWGNFIGYDMIGRMNGGDDIAPNNEYSGMYGGNTIFDIVSTETVAGNSWGVNTNSAEGGTALQSVVNCSGHGFIGMYSSDFTWWSADQRSACMAQNGSFNVPPMPGYRTIRNGGAGYADFGTGGGGTQFMPTTGGVYNQSFLNAGGLSSASAFGFSNYNGGVLTTTSNSPAKQSIVSGVPDAFWVYPGLSINDITTPDAIPAGTIVWQMLGGSVLISSNLAKPIPSGDQLQFFGQNGGPCLSISPGFIQTWGLYADVQCSSINGIQFTYYGSENLWAWGNSNKQLSGPIIGFPSSDYPGFNGIASGPVFPQGILLGAQNLTLQRPIAEGGSLYPNYHTSGLTATRPFTTANHKLIVSSCDYPIVQNGQGVLDTTIAGNPVIGFVGGNGQCFSAPTLVLTAAATQASAGIMDILTIGSVTITAGDFFSTGNTAIPVSTCTGVTVGAAVVNTSAVGSPTIGHVSVCDNENVAALTMGSAVNSVGATDSLLATSVLPGQIALDPVPTTYIGSVGKYAGPPADTAIYSYPFGQISGDTNGITWSAGTVAVTSNLPACNSTHSVAMNAVVYDGIVSPTYLQAAVGGGPGGTIRRVFCDGVSWKYD